MEVLEDWRTKQKQQQSRHNAPHCHSQLRQLSAAAQCAASMSSILAALPSSAADWRVLLSALSQRTCGRWMCW